MNTNHCDCSDPGCPCGGDCQERATMVVYRIDMDDQTGTPMCDRCGADALDSGVFTSDREDDCDE